MDTRDARAASTAASNAYAASSHVADPPASHRLDLRLDAIRQPSRSKLPARATRSDDAYGSTAQHETVHRLAHPARTGFALGFGFAAGTALLRAIVGLVGAAVVISFAWSALRFVLG